MKKAKQLIIILDGAFDEKINGKTPLMRAKTPYLDALIKASSGVFCLKTIMPNEEINSLNAHMTLFNFQKRTTPSRPNLELLGMGIKAKQGDFLWRLNIDNLGEKALNPDESEHLKKELKVFLKKLDFTLYRVNETAFILVKTASNFEKFVADKENLAEKINVMLRKSSLSERRNCQPNARLWLASRVETMTTEKQYPNCALISATPIVKALAICQGFTLYQDNSFTGDSHTNLSGKLEKSLHALNQYDTVFCHIEATDLLAHACNYNGKTEFIERFDTEFLTPLYQYLEREKPLLEIFLLPDHGTSCITGKHFCPEVKALYVQSPLKELNIVSSYNEDTKEIGEINIIKYNNGIKYLNHLF